MSQNAEGSPASAPDLKAIERRAWVRYACDFPTSCHPISAERAAGWSARIHNVSCGGLNLVGSRRFEVGTLLLIEIGHANDTLPATLLARVVHVSRKDKILWAMGCAFPYALSEDEVQALLESAPIYEK